MNETGWRLTETELRAWFDRLIEDDKRVLAPVDGGGLRLFRQVSSAEAIDMGPGKTRWSPKEFLFPRTEALYSYRLGPDGPELRDPPRSDEEQVLVGVRCCDAAGFVRLDDVFLNGKVKDPFYAQRRERTTVVAFACSEAEPECFCTAVGGSPMGTEGVDVLVVPFGAYWLVRAETDKGRAICSDEWSAASAGNWSLAEDQEHRVSQQIKRDRVPADVATALERRFESPVWNDVARQCLSCSICAYVCPSCSCFDVHHEGDAWGGREFRCWDACTYALFTRHASGHNPRVGSDARYRQRALHKFAYLASDDEEVIRCVGCGRCIALCPVGIDIHDAVSRVSVDESKGEANG